MENHYRGTFLPVELIKLYEAGILNAEEILLLAKIDALQDPTKGGCWATNGYLAVWWKKSPRWVSSSVSKFQSLGLASVIQKGDGERVIKTSLTPRKKTSTPQEENFYDPRKKTSTKYSLRNRESIAASDDAGSLLNLNEPEYSEAVSAFATFSRQRGYHIRSRYGKQVVYTKLGQPGGWTRATLQRWEEIHQRLCRHHHPEKIRRMVLRLIKYYDSEFCPEVRTFEAFANKFEAIEKFIKRERTNRIKAGEEDEEEAPYEEPTMKVEEKEIAWDPEEHERLRLEVDGPLEDDHK